MKSVNPAFEFVAALVGGGLVIAEAWLAHSGDGFEIRHVADRETPEDQLKKITLAEVRQLAQYTESGEFRPLKSAPTLRRGWRLILETPDELGLALQQLYPGAVPDLYRVARGEAAPTPYREFTARQTGMYRITTLLSDEQVALVIAGCCAARSCLKRRLWSVAGAPIDAPESKSILPCLEPCAILLESARKAARAYQSPKEPESPQS